VPEHRHKREHKAEDGHEPSARPFWSGTLSFGLVSVPVNLFPATRSSRLALRMLGPSGTPVVRRYYCPEENVDLEADDLVRGYELEDGSYVEVTDEELAAVDPKKSRDIDLRLFVPEAEIDPLLFDRPYVLTSASESPKAYRLLAEVMEREKRAGIATFVMREHEYLIAIFAKRGILRAETLRFADELRAASEIGKTRSAEPPAEMLRAFEKAIDQLSRPKFIPSELLDPADATLRQVIEKKRRAGRDVIEAPAETLAADSEVIDLMEVLKRSLPAAQPEKKPKRARSARKR
jgi:DNA end-binding protein Ku